MWNSHWMLGHKLFKLEKHFLQTSLSRGRSQTPELPNQDNIHPQGSSALLPTPLPQRLLLLPSSLKDGPRRAGNFKTRDIDCFYFSMPGKNMFFLVFWCYSKSCDDHNNSIRLAEKNQKVLKSEAETLLLQPSPAVLPPDSHQSLELNHSLNKLPCHSELPYSLSLWQHLFSFIAIFICC